MPILLELLPFGKILNAVKILCALFNQWLEFDQTSTDTSLGREKKWLDFGDLDLISKVTTL